jgi:hypothetical protein
MSEEEIRNDFAGRVIALLERMDMYGAARAVQLTLDDVNKLNRVKGECDEEDEDYVQEMGDDEG